MPASILLRNDNDGNGDNYSGWCIAHLVFEYVMKENAEIIDLIQLIAHDSGKYNDCRYTQLFGIPSSSAF